MNRINAATIATAAGWILLSFGVGLRLGPWAFLVSAGLGAVAAGLFVQLRDAVAEGLVAYFQPADGAEGSTPKPEQEPKRVHRWLTRG